MKRNLIVIALMVLLIHPALTQNNHGKGTHKGHYHHAAAIFVGNTIIKPSGFNLPTIGIEYIRELNHFFGIGLMAEAEIGSHIIMQDEHNGSATKVDRNGAILIIPAIFTRVYKGLIVSAGYGVELEANENLALFKLSLEYKLHMKNERFIVLPTVSWDRTSRFEGWVYGVNFGYVF